MVEKSTKVQTPKPFGAIWVTSASQESGHKSERKRLSPRTPALCGLGRVKVMRVGIGRRAGTQGERRRQVGARVGEREGSRLSPHTPALCGLGKVKVMRAGLPPCWDPRGARLVGWHCCWLFWNAWLLLACARRWLLCATPQGGAWRPLHDTCVAF